jgi:hypothetical protein
MVLSAAAVEKRHAGLVARGLAAQGTPHPAGRAGDYGVVVDMPLA